MLSRRRIFKQRAECSVPHLLSPSSHSSSLKPHNGRHYTHQQALPCLRKDHCNVVRPLPKFLVLFPRPPPICAASTLCIPRFPSSPFHPARTGPDIVRSVRLSPRPPTPFFPREKLKRSLPLPSCFHLAMVISLFAFLPLIID